MECSHCGFMVCQCGKQTNRSYFGLPEVSEPLVARECGNCCYFTCEEWSEETNECWRLPSNTSPLFRCLWGNQIHFFQANGSEL